MTLLIFLALLGVPLIEIGVFIEVGGYIGLWMTLVLIVATALAGTALLRHQGMATLARARASMARGRVPVREVADGFCLLVAGALLLTPGFVTDAVGFAFLLPASRVVIARRLLSKVTIIGAQSAAGPEPTIIEGEFNQRPDSRDGPDGTPPN